MPENRSMNVLDLFSGIVSVDFLLALNKLEDSEPSRSAK